MLKLNEVIEIVVISAFASVPVLVVAIFFYGLSVLIWPSHSCGKEQFSSLSLQNGVAIC